MSKPAGIPWGKPYAKHRTPEEAREYHRAYASARRAKLIEEHKCTRCSEALPAGYTKRDCESCRLYNQKAPRAAVVERTAADLALEEHANNAMADLRRCRGYAVVLGLEPVLDDLLDRLGRFALRTNS